MFIFYCIALNDSQCPSSALSVNAAGDSRDFEILTSYPPQYYSWLLVQNLPFLHFCFCLMSSDAKNILETSHFFNISGTWSSNLLFYAQSTGTVMLWSGKRHLQQNYVLLYVLYILLKTMRILHTFYWLFCYLWSDKRGRKGGRLCPFRGGYVPLRGLCPFGWGYAPLVYVPSSVVQVCVHSAGCSVLTPESGN